MTTLLIFGGIWFWILVAISGIVITACIEIEEPSGLGANITLLVTGLLLYFLGNKASFLGLGDYISQNPGSVILFFVLYVALGIVWIVVKWWLFLIDARQRIIEGNSTFWASEFRPGNHKSRITHWGIYWPFSALWTLINNPMRRLFNYIHYSIEGLLQGISDRVMKSVSDKAHRD